MQVSGNMHASLPKDTLVKAAAPKKARSSNGTDFQSELSQVSNLGMIPNPPQTVSVNPDLGNLQNGDSTESQDLAEGLQSGSAEGREQRVGVMNSEEYSTSTNRQAPNSNVTLNDRGGFSNLLGTSLKPDAQERARGQEGAARKVLANSGAAKPTELGIQNLTRFNFEFPNVTRSGSKLEGEDPLKSPLIVNYSPIEKSSLSPAQKVSTSNQLWFPVLPSTSLLAENSIEGEQELGSENEPVGNLNSFSTKEPMASVSYQLEKVQTPSEADRVLRTNLSGTDFMSALNSAKNSGDNAAMKSLNLEKGSEKDEREPLINSDFANGLPRTGMEYQLGPQIKANQNLGKTSQLQGSSGKSNFSISANPKELEPMRQNTPDDLGNSFAPLVGHPGVGGEKQSLSSPTIQVSGNVVPGAMSRERLSTDTLNTLSTNIRGLTTQGGGEIRMRLKPENLGELNIRVATIGNRVELHIQASDERSRKIIEESIGYLKDSLSSQKLSLSATDFSVDTRLSANNDPTQDSRSGNPQTGFQDTLGQQGRRGDHSHWGGGDGFDKTFARDTAMAARPLTSRLPEGMGRQYQNSNVARSGRIDVRG